MCPPAYPHNGFVAAHAFGHMIYHTTVQHVCKCMSCQKAIVVITGRAHYVYVTPILLLLDLSTLCVMDHL